MTHQLRRSCVLLHNVKSSSGNREFTATNALNTISPDAWCSSAAFADINHDGRLDLMIGEYVLVKPNDQHFVLFRGVKLSPGPIGYPAQKGRLFVNEGEGKFRDVTRESGLEAVHGKCWGAAFCDFDDDGWDDLYLADDQIPCDLMHNDGLRKGSNIPHFTNIGLMSGTALDGNGNMQGGMGIAWGDYDNDGSMDLFVTTYTNQPKSLYHNDQGSLFSEHSYPAGISQTTYPWVAFGTMWADFTNKGSLDVIIANGHVQDLVHQVDSGNDYPQRIQLFENEGKGTFRDVSIQAGDAFKTPIVGRAVAIADFDNDGRVDALVSNLEGAPVLLHNESSTHDNHWLALDLRGHSGWAAIGARVKITSGGTTQLREVRADGSYLSANDPIVHFGLGASTKIDSLSIRWPGKKWENLTPPTADQRITMRQP